MRRTQRNWTAYSPILRKQIKDISSEFVLKVITLQWKTGNQRVPGGWSSTPDTPHSGQVNDMPTAFCSRIMPLGTNDTWTEWKILSSGRFWFLLLFCHNSRSKVNFKVKYIFLPNKATSKCNTSILCDFDWKVYFWYYFNDPRSSSRSKGQFQGHIVENVIFNKNT